MDLGSALVASLPGTVAFALAIGLLRARRRTDLDPLGALGQRVAHDPHAAIAAGLVALLALGAVDALVLAAVWGAVWTLWGPATWPIAAPQGAVMGAAQSAVAFAHPGTRRRWLALLLGSTAFGAAMGLFYSPGN